MIPESLWQELIKDVDEDKDLNVFFFSESKKC